MRRKAIILSKDEAIIPPFHGVAVMEYSDRVQLSPTYWCREFVGLGRVDIKTADPEFVADLHPMLRATAGDGIWVVASWERYEDGREKALQLEYIAEGTEAIARRSFEQMVNFLNMTKEELEEIGTLFEQTPDDIAYIRNRFPEGCPDPQSLEEYDLYQARLKVLRGMQPETVALMEKANTAEHPGDRQGYEQEAVSAYFAELARHWTEDQLREWQRSNPIGAKWMCEYGRVLRSPGKRLDPVNHALVLDWLRKGLNLLTAEEIATMIFKVTGNRVSAGTIKKRRERLGLTTQRTPGPRPRVD